jgi:ribosome biogenesis GTPase A
MKKEGNIILRIDKETKDKLFLIANKNDLSASHYLRRLIKYAIDKKLKL